VPPFFADRSRFAGDRSQAGSKTAVALGLPFGDALVAVPISRFRGMAGVNSA
jgi:hypothetical protein